MKLIGEAERAQARRIAQKTVDEAERLMTGARATVESAKRLLSEREMDLQRAERNLSDAKALLELVSQS